jgi:translation initiation factor 2B subunit (eIF-2B alpha/beta/delta family)
MNSSEKLPMGLPQDIETRIEEIRLDNTSGAVRLAKKAAETLTDMVENVDVSSTSQLTAFIKLTVQALVRAQPAMAPIFNLANKTLLAIDDLTDEKEIRQAVNTSCQHFIKQLDTSGQTISKLTVDLIKDNSTIIVHSYSDTVLNSLLFAKEAGKKFDVICTESRPMKEGVYLSERLGKEGIKVTLIVDSAVFSFLPEAQLILVGADALSPHGLVNKIGTLGLALAAEKFKIDFYTLCSLEKILPANYKIKLKDQKDPKEIITETIDNVTPINYYFDITPLEYLTGILTEKGLMTPNKMKQYINTLRLHKVFSD